MTLLSLRGMASLQGGRALLYQHSHLLCSFDLDLETETARQLQGQGGRFCFKEGKTEMFSV